MNIHELEKELQNAASALHEGVKAELDLAKKNLTVRNYFYELTRIASTSRSRNSASHACSTKNLAEYIWREEAIDRLRGFLMEI